MKTRARLSGLVIESTMSCMIQAVSEGRFHIWSVGTIDEGIEVLTGRKAGVRDGSGLFEEGTVNSLVDSQLRAYSEMWANFSGGPGNPRVNPG